MGSKPSKPRMPPPPDPIAKPTEIGKRRSKEGLLRQMQRRRSRIGTRKTSSEFKDLSATVVNVLSDLLS